MYIYILSLHSYGIFPLFLDAGDLTFIAVSIAVFQFYRSFPLNKAEKKFQISSQRGCQSWKYPIISCIAVKQGEGQMAKKYTKQLCVMISPETYDRLVDVANKLQVTPSAVARQAIYNHVDHELEA